MRRSVRFALLGLALLAVPALAQEAAPAPAEPAVPAPAAPAEGAPAPATAAPVDPATTAFALPPSPDDLLTGLYATRAVAELCNITIDPVTVEAMAADEAAFIEQLGITREVADNAFAEIRTAVEGQAPDCTPGSADVAGVEEVLAVYAAEPEADAATTEPAGTTTPAAAEPAAAPAQ